MNSSKALSWLGGVRFCRLTDTLQIGIRWDVFAFRSEPQTTAGTCADTMRTHYHTLGIPVDATTERVKEAYRALVKMFHPDLFPSDSDAQAEAGRRIREVNVAYAVLSNPERREQYDAKLNIRIN